MSDRSGCTPVALVQQWEDVEVYSSDSDTMDRMWPCSGLDIGVIIAWELYNNVLDMIDGSLCGTQMGILV